MIIKMKKYSFLVYHKEYEKFLEDIRELGVFHVIENKDEIPEIVKEKINIIKKIDSTLKSLKTHLEDKKPSEKIVEGVDCVELTERVEKLLIDIDQNYQKLHQLNKEYHNQEIWGDFSVETVKELKKSGVELKLFSVPARLFEDEWKEKYAIEKVSERGGNINFALFYKTGEEVDIKAEEVRMFDRSLSEISNEIKSHKEKIKTDDTDIAETAIKYYRTLENYRSSVENEKHYSNVKEQAVSSAEDKLLILEGWVPVTKEENAKNYLDENGFLYLEREPEEDEIPKVPIMMKNGRYASMFEPITRLFSLPAYNELDLTVFFAPFFMLFFGFCLGDAGYGIVLISVGAILKFKLDQEWKPMLSLIQFLGLMTVIMGIVGGTFFGLDLKVVDWRFNDLPLDSNSMFWLALGLGVVQILFGMCIKAANQIRQKGWMYSISTFGWMLLVISFVGMSLKAVMGYLKVEQAVIESMTYLDTISAIAGKTALIGVAVILLFNDPKANIFIRILKGMWQLYDITGLFGDVLSYIRLFALGVSGAILGLVINEIAAEFLKIPYIGWLIFIVFLIIGHVGNILLSGLGSLVHPMRLTFVEFYKNAGWTGGGKEYAPFKKDKLELSKEKI